MDYQDEVYREARKRVKKKKGFYNHLKAYIIVNAAFSLITLFSGEPFGWFPIIIFWGIGLAFHYAGVFGIPGIGELNKEWEAKEMKKEINKLTGGNTAFDDQLPEEELPLRPLQKDYKDSDLV
jgi:hypothetical protein